MLNSNQACLKEFSVIDLNKLNLKRLKSFKKSCERFHGRFKTTRCNIVLSPENYTEEEHAQFRTWTWNMTSIRVAILNKSGT